MKAQHKQAVKQAVKKTVKQAVKLVATQLPIGLPHLSHNTDKISRLTDFRVECESKRQMALAEQLAAYKALSLAAYENECKGIKSPVVKAGSEPKAKRLDPYGRKWPTVGTSAHSIWVACEAQGVTASSNTKLMTAILAGLNLQCNKGPVNYNNIAIEINSYKKYLANNS